MKGKVSGNGTGWIATIGASSPIIDDLEKDLEGLLQRFNGQVVAMGINDLMLLRGLVGNYEVVHERELRQPPPYSVIRQSMEFLSYRKLKAQDCVAPSAA